MAEYLFVDQTHVPDLVAQVTELNIAAFAEYEGAPTFGEDFTEWYLRRPGCTPELCTAALHGDKLVSMVLVAIQPVQLGGETLDCGIIDSVATHPDHRRRGLARRLMDMAHEKMRSAGAGAAVLYTNPEDHPYRFYGRLGYQTRAMCEMLQGRRPKSDASLSVRAARTAEHEMVAEMLNEFYGTYEGYAPFGDELWAWHKIVRPEGMAPLILVAEAEQGPAATCTCAEVPLLLQGKTVTVAAVSDFAYRSDACDGAEALVSLLAAAPRESLVCLFDESDPLAGLYRAIGFEKAVSEVSMVLPFSNTAQDATRSKPGPWYVMVESVIGV